MIKTDLEEVSFVEKDEINNIEIVTAKIMLPVTYHNYPTWDSRDFITLPDGEKIPLSETQRVIEKE